MSVLAAVFVLWVHTLDLELNRAADAIPDYFIDYAPTVRPPNPTFDMKALANTGEAPQTKQKPRKQKPPVARRPRRTRPKRATARRSGSASHAQRSPCGAECKAQLRQKVLKQIGALAREPGGTRDLLAKGDPQSDLHRAFDDLGGVTTASSDRKLRTRGSNYGKKATGIGDPRRRALVTRAPSMSKERSKNARRRSWSSPRAKPKITGTLDADDVSQVVRRGMRGLSSCYQRAIKRSATAAGKIELCLTINAAGRVYEVDL